MWKVVEALGVGIAGVGGSSPALRVIVHPNGPLNALLSDP